MFRPGISVFDCTIRDGGLINNHFFKKDFVKKVFKAIAKSGIDYMEVGYKNSDKIFDRKEYGLWKFCDESDIRDVIEKTHLKISAMVDIGRVFPEDILPFKDSILDMIRVATYVKDIDKAIGLANMINDKGYEATINIMAISKALDPELGEALEQIESETKVKAVYVVDSFGALYSEEVHYLVEKYQKHLKTKEVGIHAHNNMQLAYANTIEAVIKGANFLDATIFGIGRAAGNCPLELLLAFLKNPKFDVAPILEVIQSEFLKLRNEIEWGYIIPYMITGMFNEHPRSAIAYRKTSDKDDYTSFYNQFNSVTE